MLDPVPRPPALLLHLPGPALLSAPPPAPPSPLIMNGCPTCYCHSLELLLRKLLLLPGRPAVALLNGYRWQGQFILPGPAKRDALGV